MITKMMEIMIKIDTVHLQENLLLVKRAIIRVPPLFTKRNKYLLKISTLIIVLV